MCEGEYDYDLPRTIGEAAAPAVASKLNKREVAAAYVRPADVLPIVASMLALEASIRPDIVSRIAALTTGGLSHVQALQMSAKIATMLTRFCRVVLCVRWHICRRRTSAPGSAQRSAGAGDKCAFGRAP